MVGAEREYPIVGNAERKRRVAFAVRSEEGILTEMEIKGIEQLGAVTPQMLRQPTFSNDHLVDCAEIMGIAFLECMDNLRISHKNDVYVITCLFQAIEDSAGHKQIGIDLASSVNAKDILMLNAHDWATFTS